MSMQRKNWDSVEGIVDVGPIVMAHCDNPCKIEAIEFLEDALTGKRKLIIPTSCFLGAFHILTRYLRINRKDAMEALEKTLKIDSPAIFEEISRIHVIQAIEYAGIYNIQSWDGYLLGLARLFKTKNIYTLDKDLGKIEGFSALTPLSEDKIKQYHTWVENLNKNFK
jgi:predicted nucleic acid-binding protein